jgi:hypothetical protein
MSDPSTPIAPPVIDPAMRELIIAVLREHLEIEVDICTHYAAAGRGSWPEIGVSVTFDGVEVASHSGAIEGLVTEEDYRADQSTSTWDRL